MSKAAARDPIYRGRRFQPEIIELCVRWYLTYRLSYRDLVEMMAERGVVISHSTILRWVQRYAIRKSPFTFGSRGPHQNSPTGVRMLTEAQIQAIKPVRYERKVTDGQGLYLVVTPKGALHWRFRYRFAGKCKTLALGSYPVVTLDWDRSHQKSFRDLLAHGVDPAALKAALGELRFGLTMRECEAEQGRIHSGTYLCPP